MRCYSIIMGLKVYFMDDDKKVQGDCVVIKALSSGVQIIGLTRGDDTRSHHIEMLDSGEVMVAQFTDRTSAIKIKGDAEIYTAHGVVTSERKKIN